MCLLDGTSAAATCKACPAGFACSVGCANPSPCSAGEYSNEGAAQCELCIVGHYCDVPEMTYEDMMKKACDPGLICSLEGVHTPQLLYCPPTIQTILKAHTKQINPQNCSHAKALHTQNTISLSTLTQLSPFSRVYGLGFGV